MPDEDDAIVHYAPGEHPLCGNDSITAVYTDDPALVAGCADCLELVAEDLDEDNEHWANCLHCQQEISARNGVEWRRVARAPARTAGGLVMGWTAHDQRHSLLWPRETDVCVDTMNMQHSVGSSASPSWKE